MRHRRLALFALLLSALLVGGGAMAPAAAHPPPGPYCGITWGSLPKSADAQLPDSSAVAGVRAGRHDCYDRLVVDVGGARAFDAYDVRYVSEVTADGSGDVVPLRGGAALQVVVRAPAYDVAGNPTYLPAVPSELVDVGGYRTFRQVAWAGSFEGQTTLGLGVRARLPFRVFTLPGIDGSAQGTRIVVDVAHRW